MKIYKLVIMMALAASAGAGTVYQVNVDTSSLTGTLGNLDFTFAAGMPAPPLGTVTIMNFNSNGTLGVPQITGDASGLLGTQVLLNNTSFPPPDFYTPFTYGTELSFDFAISGPAVMNPDGVSGSSTFAFSLLDNGNPPNPVLLQNPIPEGDLGGFAFTVDLNNDGSLNIQNYMASGTIGPAISGVPEPGTWGGLSLGLGALVLLGRSRALHHVRNL